MQRTITICLLVAMAFVAKAHGEIPLLSKEELRSDATHIVSGPVQAIYTEETKDAQWLKVAGVVEIQVAKLEKGDKLTTGDRLYARFWTEAWIGKGTPPPFGSGHWLPKKGDKVRVYLKQNDGGFDALLPNGFEVLPKPAEAKPMP